MNIRDHTDHFPKVIIHKGIPSQVLSIVKKLSKYNLLNASGSDEISHLL